MHCNNFQARYVSHATALHCSTVSFLRSFLESERGPWVLRLPDVKPPCSTARQIPDLAGLFLSVAALSARRESVNALRWIATPVHVAIWRRDRLVP